MTTHEIITQEKVLEKIREICNKKGYTTLTELCKVMDCYPTNLHLKINILANRGHIIKVKSPYDGRKNLIYISENGKNSNSH